MAPFGRALANTPLTLFAGLRPEFNFLEKANSDQDLVILTFENTKAPKLEIPNGYFLYSEHRVPAAAFIPSGHRLFLLAPKNCQDKRAP